MNACQGSHPYDRSVFRPFMMQSVICIEEGGINSMGSTNKDELWKTVLAGVSLPVTFAQTVVFDTLFLKLKKNRTATMK